MCVRANLRAQVPFPVLLIYRGRWLRSFMAVGQTREGGREGGQGILKEASVQRWTKRWTCFAKQQPGRAKQKVLAHLSVNSCSDVRIFSVGERRNIRPFSNLKSSNPQCLSFLSSFLCVLDIELFCSHEAPLNCAGREGKPARARGHVGA